VTLFYDSLLGKIIVWASDRTEAIRRMRRALGELVVAGVATNQSFHLRLLEDPAFLAAEFDSQFLERRPDLLTPLPDELRLETLAVAAALAEDEARLSRRPQIAEAPEGASTWQRVARLEGLR
jgi:acetyl/propionyl-CoA carboxylase alpha subunit